MQETWVWSLGWEDPLEKEMATHSSILAWRIPWMEEPGRLQSTGLQRVGHNWATSLSLFTWKSSDVNTSAEDIRVGAPCYPWWWPPWAQQEGAVMGQCSQTPSPHRWPHCWLVNIQGDSCPALWSAFSNSSHSVFENASASCFVNTHSYPIRDVYKTHLAPGFSPRWEHSISHFLPQDSYF